MLFARRDFNRLAYNLKLSRLRCVRASRRDACVAFALVAVRCLRCLLAAFAAA
ncbi:hypothetical protein GVAMD_0817 [Gardnerella vaginalis AMD]|nr:hypothetical protein GVAMD_0817 [Gardnerella vaginalis AMD]